MKYYFVLMITLIFISPAQSATETVHHLSVGADQQLRLWFRQKTIDKKEVHLVGYRSPQGNLIEKVMPKKDYKVFVDDFKLMTKELRSSTVTSRNPFCEEVVWTGENKNRDYICMSSASNPQRVKVAVWMKRVSDLAVGVN